VPATALECQQKAAQRAYIMQGTTRTVDLCAWLPSPTADIEHQPDSAAAKMKHNAQMKDAKKVVATRSVCDVTRHTMS